MNSSPNYYLERVGLEAKLNHRHSLKNGENLIGRFDAEGVDIGINSLLCSRYHCRIDVSDDSVTVEDLNVSFHLFFCSSRESIMISGFVSSIL